jgi:hypothetical protein
MKCEEAWNTCPIEISNTALRIARVYGHLWANCSVVPQGNEFWKPGDKRPTIRDIWEASSNISGEGLIRQPDVKFTEEYYLVNYMYSVSEMEGNPELKFTVSLDNYFNRKDNSMDLGVIITRNKKEDVACCYMEVGKIDAYADPSAWSSKHVGEWNKAWKALGREAPKFPGELRERVVKLEPNHTAIDDVRFATVIISPNTLISSQELIKLSEADSVSVLSEDGSIHSII